MKIFYSWQMDAPRKINKDLIHGALSDAITKLGEELDLSEAERDEIELDQDTQGVPGSPEISRVIFEKIAASRVVVTDVSLVARGNQNRPHINSNVAIELGYAYGKNLDASVLKVMNTHYGKPSDLPFDLRIRRHPVQYELAPDSNRATIEAERKKLAGLLAEILRGYLGRVAPAQIAPHAEVPSVGMRGRYWAPADALVPQDANRRVPEGIFCDSASVLYFRCLPLIALPELSPLEAMDFSRELPPLYCERGYSHARNRWGAVTYDSYRSVHELIGATQLFRNREIWGIDVTLASCETSPGDYKGESKRFIPTSAVQRDYPRAIDSFRKVAEKLGFGDRYVIEIGISGAEGVHLAIDRRYFDSLPGPFYVQEAFIRKTISNNYPTMQIMSDFWDKLCSEVNRAVPDELMWKPIVV